MKRRTKSTRFESPAQEAMLNLIIAASHLRDMIDKICADYSITHGQYNVLRILRGTHPQGHSRCKIAQRLLERAPDVTRLIDRLEQQKLVERGKSEEDRRLSVNRITQEGIKLLDRMQPAIDELHKYFTDRVSLKDRRELSRICEGIYDDEV